MERQSERGIALVMTMILLVVMSVMAVSLTFVSKTETWSSMNYRLMSQARDAAEAGINTTANYLMNAYAAPTNFAAYNINARPVQTTGNISDHDIILSASSMASNYPVTADQSAFNADGAGKGNMSAGFTNIKYKTSAKLLAMQSLGAVPPFTSSATTIQTWEIQSDGTVDGVQTANEQVTAVLERTIFPIFAYAAFATSNDCSALQFGGGGTTDSYAGIMSGGHPVISATNGNVGTNGNLATNGNPTTINGTLSTPRIGTGTCSAGNVTAWTAANGTVTGGVVELPQPVNYPTPTVPGPSANVAPYNVATNSGCGTLSGCTDLGSDGLKLDASVVGGACAATTPPSCSMNLYDVSMTGGKDLHLTAGTYNINSIKEVGNTKLILDSGPVILNVTGNGGGTVVDLSGGSVTNPSATYDSTSFQIYYAGTGTVSLKGGNDACGVLYAPNATFSFGGNANWYGAVVGKNMADMGGTGIHYDRRLKDKFFVPGPYMLSAFTWNKY